MLLYCSREYHLFTQIFPRYGTFIPKKKKQIPSERNRAEEGVLSKTVDEKEISKKNEKKG